MSRRPVLVVFLLPSVMVSTPSSDHSRASSTQHRQNSALCPTEPCHPSIMDTVCYWALVFDWSSDISALLTLPISTSKRESFKCTEGQERLSFWYLFISLWARWKSILMMLIPTTKGEKQKPPGQNMSPIGKLLVSSQYYSKSAPSLYVSSQCMLGKAVAVSALTLRLWACVCAHVPVWSLLQVLQ